MKQFKRHLICILLVPFMAQAQSILFPTPNSIQQNKEVFIVNRQLEINAEDSYSKQLAQQLSTDLADLAVSDKRGKSVVQLSVDPQLDMEKEGYQLHITKDTAWLQANSSSGLFYAKEAFLQLVRFHKGELSALQIHDTPRFQWRGFMLDESRHFFGKEKLKQYLDLMASLRLNVFHWHLTDEPGWRIEIKRYPKLTTMGSMGNWHDPNAEAQFYTQEDIREIVAYAAEKQIMIVPEIDMPGHATAACRAYPEVSGGGTGRWNGFTFHSCRR